MKFTIPASIEDATSALTGVERLLTAKEWERCAIVAAFVTLDNKPGPKSSVTSDRSPERFAALGIAGLKSKNTVQRYVERWEATGRAKPRPGEVIDLDGLPGWNTGTDEDRNVPTKTKAQDVATQPGAVAAALADPTFRQKVIDRADETTKRGLSKDSVRAVVEDTVIRTGGRVPQAGVDYNHQSNGTMDAIIAEANNAGEVGDALRNAERLVKAYGPISEDHDLAPIYWRVQMLLATSVIAKDEAVTE
jgi:hypothetical protein